MGVNLVHKTCFRNGTAKETFAFDTFLEDSCKRTQTLVVGWLDTRGRRDFEHDGRLVSNEISLAVAVGYMTLGEVADRVWPAETVLHVLDEFFLD